MPRLLVGAIRGSRGERVAFLRDITNTRRRQRELVNSGIPAAALNRSRSNQCGVAIIVALIAVSENTRMWTTIIPRTLRASKR